MFLQHKANILLVDDQPENLKLLRHILVPEFHVMAVTSGETALKVVQQNEPDLILLDIMMPDMDGYEVIRRLKDEETTKNIPVIFVTAMQSVEDEARGLSMGAEDYITKPIRHPIVLQRVRNQIQSSSQRKLLEKLINVDYLTQVANRRHFDSVMETEWRRAERTEEPLSVFIADVDFFKNYNDTCGHAMGDEVLKKISAALQRCTRRGGDLVARYGGEEFVLLLPNTTEEGGKEMAERARRLVAGLHIPGNNTGETSRLTVSIGGATIYPPYNDILPADLLEQADVQMYAAKNAGRNRVMWTEFPL